MPWKMETEDFLNKLLVATKSIVSNLNRVEFS